MKLAAMEGLWNGSHGHELVAVGILNPEKRYDNDADPYLFKIGIPKGLSVLARNDFDAFVPGISDIIAGVDYTADGTPSPTVSYADRIQLGKVSHEALRAFDSKNPGEFGDMDNVYTALENTYPYFGYGYLDSPSEAIPACGHDLLFVSYHGHSRRVSAGVLRSGHVLPVSPAGPAGTTLASVGVHAYHCGGVDMQSGGWICAEVGRQPWIIQDLMPVRAAISDISAASVQLTFWMFAVVFTVLLAAEMSIMLRQISKGSRQDLELNK